ncbi:MAG: hypothetical protein KJ955_00310 [Nanoarchaeota archaeon]|nr:hypothetical protein [Nanoarchaeota archaeon]
MNDYEKTVLRRVLEIGGKLLEGVAVYGLFYNAINPNQDSLRNAYIAAGTGVAGICLDKIGNKIVSHVKEIKHIRERKQIQKQLEEIVSENNIRMGLPAETRPEDRVKARAAEYARMQGRK